MTWAMVVDALAFVDAAWAILLAYALGRTREQLREMSDRYEGRQGPHSTA